MKILHISTGSNGGAHRASMRLAQSQREYGHQVTFIDSPSVLTHTVPSNPLTFIKLRVLAALVSRLNKMFTRRGVYYLTPISISRINLKAINKINPDVVHIHNWFNILSASEIQKIASNYPVVITMHDERILTGGCHYTFECTKYNNGCHSCPGSRITTVFPAIGFRETRKMFLNVNIGVISPSNWLFSKVENSLGNKIAYLSKLSNIQDETFTQPRESNLDSRKKVFTFIAADPVNPTKGLNILLEALDYVASNSNINIKLNIVGERMPELLKPFEIEQHGVLNSTQIRKIFQMTDFTLVPSLQDNSPSVVIESMLTGTPVIGTNVGGIPELVINGVSGFTTPPSANALSQTILNAMQMTSVQNEELRIKTYNYAQTEFDRKGILEKVEILYQKIIDLNREFFHNDSL